MHNLLNYASIVVSVKYNTKYLLSCSKALFLEKLMNFCLVKKVNCKLKIHFLENRSGMTKALYLKQVKYFRSLYICKKYKYCQDINKNQFLAVLEKGYFLHLVRKWVQE